VAVDHDAVVVGAGICGLATAYELARRGARVLVLERAGVGAEQSAGLARIFRIAHGNARLCALALEAREAWRRWERDLGAGRLLGPEGLVVAGATAEPYAAAMREAGAEVVELDGAAIREQVPPLSPDAPWEHGILDPLGGSTRVQRTLRALAERVEVRRAEVVAVEDGPDAAVVGLADGTRLHAGAVVLCAGTATGPLAATAGIALAQEAFHHVRLTYAPRQRPDGFPACLIAPGIYALPVGTTHRWALGLDDPGEPQPYATVPADQAAAAVRHQHAELVPRLFAPLDPEPVDEIRCVWLRADWLGSGEDGFTAERRGRVIALGASNAMKFGPLLGDRLAATALAGDEWVHPDLRPA
jgi:glycine/D-amino acid oxidase-like deaminating enzyme